MKISLPTVRDAFTKSGFANEIRNNRCSMRICFSLSLSFWKTNETLGMIPQIYCTEWFLKGEHIFLAYFYFSLAMTYFLQCFINACRLLLPWWAIHPRSCTYIFATHSTTNYLFSACLGLFHRFRLFCCVGDGSCTYWFAANGLLFVEIRFVDAHLISLV